MRAGQRWNSMLMHCVVLNEAMLYGELENHCQYWSKHSMLNAGSSSASERGL